MGAGTTETGFINHNGQRNAGRVTALANHANQYLYRMQCTRCQARYRANGCDVYGRKCPYCQGGRPSSEAH
ncbi:MAG: hypothetical protein AAFR47_18195 [Pseudomonadota bacterium]